jgi:hypothetical protein
VTQMVSAERAADLCKGCECFRSWHKSEVPTALSEVRFQGQPGRHFARTEFFSV